MNVCWQESYAFRIMVYSFQSVSCFIIVGLMIFVSSLTVPFREVTLSLERNEVCAKESLFLTCDFFYQMKV